MARKTSPLHLSSVNFSTLRLTCGKRRANVSMGTRFDAGSQDVADVADSVSPLSGIRLSQYLTFPVPFPFPDLDADVSATSSASSVNSSITL